VYSLADSNITKKALAAALKELMEEKPFEKINVGDICEKCDMNRKSFYYHFKDKYDLVNWIFDIEFITVFSNESIESQPTNDEFWKTIEVFLQLIYQNRGFYRNALKVKGQNSFSDHFRECIHPILEKKIEIIMNAPISDPFTVNFISDACLCALERWLFDKSSMPPEQFCRLLKNLVQTISVSISNEMKADT